MKLSPRTTVVSVATFATAGVSTLALGAAPAAAVPSDGCGPDGDLIAPGVCEQVFTDAANNGVFTPTADMTKLEALLVGPGGNGGSGGYAAGGGGGEVKIVDLSGAANPITVDVGQSFTSTTLSGGATESAMYGSSGELATVDDDATATGGVSGSGQVGGTETLPSDQTPAAGGGGAGGPGSGRDGGVGVVVSAIAPVDSLFADDDRCFGGGGAAGADGVDGVAVEGCGGGDPSTAARANSGGGGGATPTTSLDGAVGLAVFRWNAGTVTLSFDANGHGTAPAPQSIVAGMPASEPAVPTAEGFEFTGWYTDATLATLADFSAINSSTTYYAGWRAVLPATGSEPSPVALASGLAALVAGAGFLAITAHRRRRDAD